MAHSPDSFVIQFNVTPDVPPTSISWLFSSGSGLSPQNITGNPGIFQTFSSDRHSLTLNPVIRQHEGVYTFIATDSGGMDFSSSVTLNVQSELLVLEISN